MKVVSGHSKPKKAAEHKGRRASHMTIERAENGLMVTTHHVRPKAASKQQEKSMMMENSYEAPEKKVFAGRQELMDHMADKFGDVLPENDAPVKKSAAATGGGNHGSADDEEEEEEGE